MDVRTYAQMIRGVAEHGLPYWDNGPLDRFTALLVPWGVAAGGHVWGTYGPLYPYLAAPAFRVGSLQLVSEFTFALLCPLALATFLVARCAVRSEWYAVLAGALVVFSTPVLAKAVEITAYPLVTVMAAVATYFSLRSLDLDGAARRAALLGSGVAWGGCCASHALGFPMTVAAIAAVAAVPGRPGDRGRASVAAERLAFAGAGLAVVIVPMALLNHLRFGSYNPVSYGPVPWTGDLNPALLKQNVGDELRYGAPCAVFGAALATALLLARKRRGWMIAIGVAGVALALIVPPLRTRLLRFGLMAFGNLVDLDPVGMGSPYERPADGLGQFFGGHLVKATLQCTPLLALAPLALRFEGARRWRVVVLLVPSAALFAALALRANLPNVDAIGWPWTYIRYTLPALPMLIVASVAVLEDLRPTLGDAAVALLVALVLSVGLSAADEHRLATRLALLVWPVVVAVLAFVAIARDPERAGRMARAGRLLAAAALGTGVAVALAQDYPGNASVKVGCDDLVDRFAKVVPERFAFVGVLGEFDVLLSIAATHDVEYADLLRLPGFAAIRPLLDYWRSDGRPTYLLSMITPPSPWADVSYQPVAGVDHVYLVQFVPPEAATR